MIVRKKNRLRDQVRDRIVSMIAEAGMVAGDQLKSEKNLAEMFNVNHLTIRAALSDLVTSGIVDRRSGSGTFYTGKLESDAGIANSIPDASADIKRHSSIYSADHSAISNNNYIPKQINVQINKSFPSTNKSASQTETSDYPKLASIMLHAEPHFFDDLLLKITNGLQQRCLVTNFRLTTEEITNATEIQKGLERALAVNPDLLIVQHSIFVKSPELRDYFNARAKPTTIRLLCPRENDWDYAGYHITCDFIAGNQTVISRLKALGHERITYLSGSQAEGDINQRENRRFAMQYAEAMINEGLSSKIHIFMPEQYKENCSQSFFHWYMAQPESERPTALITIHDYTAVQIIDIFRANNIDVPGDVSVVGFADTPWSTHYNMSSLRIPSQQIAAEIQTFLLGNRETTTKILPLEYIERSTVGAVKQ